MHKSCWDEYSSFKKNNNKPLDCPICRHEFKEGDQFAVIKIEESNLKQMAPQGVEIQPQDKGNVDYNVNQSPGLMVPTHM